MSDPQQKLRAWLQDELAKRGHGAKSGLAKALNVRPDAITRMLNTDPQKETRAIEAHEHEKMKEFFYVAPEPIRSSDEIRDVLARIEGLKPDNVTVLLSAIQGFQQANVGQPSQARQDDQSELATRRRESSPSR